MLNFDEYIIEGKLEDVDISIGDLITYITSIGSRRKGYVRKIENDVYRIINTDGETEEIKSKDILKILDKEEGKNQKFLKFAEELSKQEEKRELELEVGSLIEYEEGWYKYIMYVAEKDDKHFLGIINGYYNLKRINKKYVKKVLDKESSKYKDVYKRFTNLYERIQLQKNLKDGDIISFFYKKKYVCKIQSRNIAHFNLIFAEKNTNFPKIYSTYGNSTQLRIYDDFYLKNIEKITDKDKIEKFEKKLKEYESSFPDVNDYAKIDNNRIATGIIKITKRQNSNHNINYEGLVDYLTGKDNKVIFNSDYGKITKLNPDSKEVKDFEKRLKNIKIPKKGDFIKFNYKTYKSLVAFVNNNLDSDYYGNVTIIKLKFAKPIEGLTKNTTSVKLGRGLTISISEVKELEILDPESDLVKKYQKEDAEFTSDIPKVGEYFIHKPTGKLCIVTKSTKSGIISVDFLEYLEKKPKGINITSLEKTESHPLIEFIKKGIYGKVKFSKKVLYLLPKNAENTFSDISYVDITDNIDDVSFIGLRKANEIETEDERWTAKGRQTTKIGRFIGRVFPSFTQKQVEEAVNNYKANYKVFVLGESPIEVVEGEDIRYWYDAVHYEKGGGTLNNSCMRGKDAQPRMDLYVTNPEKIKLLILRTPDKKKLLGRALLWYVDEPKGVIYMDRIYTRFDHDVKLFNLYADSKGYSKRTDTKMKRMLLKVKPKAYYTLPYRDTFYNYNAREHILSNC